MTHFLAVVLDIEVGVLAAIAVVRFFAGKP